MFDAETLDLFRKLEYVPMRRRNGREFKDREHELARRIDLTSQWRTGNSVLNRRGMTQADGLGCQANDDWRRCRAVRESLLDAIKDH
jgi:hypothetical protein